MVFVCWKCGKEVKDEEIGLEEGIGVRCSYCGNKVLFKKTPPVSKKVKAV